MLPLLYNTPRDETGWLEWGSAHQLDHFEIARQIFAKFQQQQIIVAPIDPIPLRADLLPGWALNHQAIHTQQNAILGINGSDLTGVDFRRPQEVAIWIFLHAKEHYAAASALAHVQPAASPHSTAPAAAPAASAQTP